MLFRSALEPKFWQNFCEALGRDDWLQAHYSKPDMSNPVYREVADLFKSKTLSEWSEFGIQVDCCLAPVLEAGELAEFPYFKAKEFVFDQGQIKMHGDIEGVAGIAPPEKGGQTEEILREWLGTADEQMEVWKNNGVI